MAVNKPSQQIRIVAKMHQNVMISESACEREDDAYKGRNDSGDFGKLFDAEGSVIQVNVLPSAKGCEQRVD